MKIQKDVIGFVKGKLAVDAKWAERAIVKLFERQTSDEQSSQNTKMANGQGFTSNDAFILSSFAEQINRGRTLSPKQLAIAFHKLPKYGKQVAGFIPEDKLAQIAKELEKKRGEIPAPVAVEA